MNGYLGLPFNQDIWDIGNHRHLCYCFDLLCGFPPCGTVCEGTMDEGIHPRTFMPDRTFAGAIKAEARVHRLYIDHGCKIVEVCSTWTSRKGRVSTLHLQVKRRTEYFLKIKSSYYFPIFLIFSDPLHCPLFWRCLQYNGCIREG